LLADPTTRRNPFYLLAPEWALYPMIVLATCATVIASQAVISGVFSLTRQAIQLGYLPRMDIRHTSATEMGQIYIPQINWLLAIGVVLIVIMFQTSSALTHAYGLAVTGAVTIDCLLAMVVARWLWGWNRWLAYGVFGAFLAVDLMYGRPFHTPTVLGTALFGRGVWPATLEALPPSFEMVAMFTWVHVLAFAVVGVAVARLITLVERHPSLGFGFVLLFVILEACFTVAAMIVAEPVLRALTWPAILAANVLAAAVMAGYFWLRHRTMQMRP
jgi:hypothetical protein